MNQSQINKHNQIVGKWGEEYAVVFLEDKGYRIVARNIRTPEGEIDIIVEKDGLLVFVEVKARSHNKDGYPEEAVTEEKMEHMLNSAEHYLQDYPEYAENWRIDVLAVTGSPNDKKPIVEWFENAA